MGITFCVQHRSTRDSALIVDKKNIDCIDDATASVANSFSGKCGLKGINRNSMQRQSIQN
jgi:hypothetical protein